VGGVVQGTFPTKIDVGPTKVDVVPTKLDVHPTKIGVTRRGLE
jgi:hypothetical protein